MNDSEIVWGVFVKVFWFVVVVFLMGLATGFLCWGS